MRQGVHGAPARGSRRGQPSDSVHLLLKGPPKVSVSGQDGKGRTTVRGSAKSCEVRLRHYWDDRFWAHEYFVDTGALAKAKSRAYVRYQSSANAPLSRGVGISE